MPVLQTTIRDCRLKSLAVTYSQRSQQPEMHEYFTTSACRTGAREEQMVFCPSEQLILLQRFEKVKPVIEIDNPEMPLIAS